MQTRLDHIALIVDNPQEAADWYINQFGGSLLYCDKTWAFVQLDNIKLAFVMKGLHPAHFAFKVDDFDEGETIKEHRDNTLSVYKKDPWGNIYELIKYPEKT